MEGEGMGRGRGVNLNTLENICNSDIRFAYFPEGTMA